MHIIPTESTTIMLVEIIMSIAIINNLTEEKLVVTHSQNPNNNISFLGFIMNNIHEHFMQNIL